MPAPERDEEPAQLSDRKLDELLQYLRVTQTSLQIVLGFLMASVGTPGVAPEHSLSALPPR
ncbi:DUF6328 family protein [Phycicoccus sp. Root101]|uniref:DUF6328 family protein n=1 Tax=Phycicoccus sp. Root101 TaxID=1736421 RepID=UPI0007036223|nr:hypothetical protein ASC58_03720 [Phycicoccus sp. Root101]